MVDFLIRGDAGVMAELRNVRKKTEVEVLPVVDLSGISAFQIFFVGDATQVYSYLYNTTLQVVQFPEGGMPVDR